MYSSSASDQIRSKLNHTNPGGLKSWEDKHLAPGLCVSVADCFKFEISWQETSTSTPQENEFVGDQQSALHQLISWTDY